VLPENTGMLKVFANSGLPCRKTQSMGSVRLALRLV